MSTYSSVPPRLLSIMLTRTEVSHKFQLHTKWLCVNREVVEGRANYFHTTAWGQKLNTGKTQHNYPDHRTQSSYRSYENIATHINTEKSHYDWPTQQRTEMTGFFPQLFSTFPTRLWCLMLNILTFPSPVSLFLSDADTECTELFKIQCLSLFLRSARHCWCLRELLQSTWSPNTA